LKFSDPITVRLDGDDLLVEDVYQARNILIGSWPGERGPRHRDALETCLKVIDGHRSTIDAEMRFRDAAREAGILATNDAAQARS
jgi:hypothetical protein